jgi:hypothetical protein
MSRALLEMALHASAGFKVTHTPYSTLAVSLKSAQQSIGSMRGGADEPKKRFFQAKIGRHPRKHSVSGDLGVDLMKVNGLSRRS